jgi:hypothetical protein
MRLLVRLVQAIHYTMGISVPPPRKERFYVFLWITIFFALIAWFVFMVYLAARLI